MVFFKPELFGESADRINGHAYAYSVEVASVCLSSVAHALWLNGAFLPKICLKKQIDRGESNGHVTLKDQGHDTNTLRAQYLENSSICYLALIAITTV